MKRNPLNKGNRMFLRACTLSMLFFANGAFAADKALLDTLLQNGAINQKQYDALIKVDTTETSTSLLDVLKQNGAITQEQYSGLAKQAPAAIPDQTPAQATVATPAVIASGDGVIRGKGGATEGGAPEPPRVGKEILPGVSATFGGYIESASMYRSKNESQDVNSNFNASIPFDNSVNAHQTEFRESARQSRISLLLGGDYDKNTKLNSYLEMDFLAAGSSSNANQASSYSPRLRLGYATVDKTDWGFHFLGGQAWSMLTTNKVGINPRTENVPLTVDASYIPGFNWTRNSQIRFVQDFADQKVWAGLSLESPQYNPGGITAAGATVNPLTGQQTTNTVAAVNAGGGSLTGTNYSTDVAPDIIGKVAFDPGWGHYEMFGITRFFHSAINNLTNTNVSNHVVESLGGGAAAILPVIPKKLDIQMNFMGGSGIGRYSSAQLADAAFSTSGAMVPLTEYTALLGIIGHPTPNWDVYTYLGGEFIDRYNQNIATNVGNAGAQLTAQQNQFLYGYGSSNLMNSGCSTIGATQTAGGPANASLFCQAQTQAVWQITPGFWAKLYDGNAGTLKTGLQYSYTQRNAFSGQNGVAPHADESIFMLSVRYYPLQK